MKDHSCFEHFYKWHDKSPPGYKINFLGAKRKTKYQNFEISQQRKDVNLPNFDEEYFEWIDMLEAVLNSKDCFTIIELGAGYGRWSVNGAIAAKIVGKDYRIIAVVPEPQHFKWLQENIIDNDLDKNRCKLVEAAVAGSAGECEFFAGDPNGWYGQRIHFENERTLNEGELKRGVYFTSVKQIDLTSLLENEETIDLIDMDVQGSEFEIIQSATKEISSKVKKIHIGTHSHEIEEGLRCIFRDMEYIPTYDYECKKIHKTEFGEIYFVDGVQGWINPK